MPDFAEDSASAEEVPEARRGSGQTDPLATYCGTLPIGKTLKEFYHPPACVHARNADGWHWHIFPHVQFYRPPSLDTKVVVFDIFGN